MPTEAPLSSSHLCDVDPDGTASPVRRLDRAGLASELPEILPPAAPTSRPPPPADWLFVPCERLASQSAWA